MMGEILRALVGARCPADPRPVKRLQHLADALMQPATPNRIQLLVEHLADLVVREREDVVGAGSAARAFAGRANELGCARFVERVEQRVVARR